MNYSIFFGLALLLSLSTPSYSKVIQLIHTNDLHSYFEGTRGGIGGYARLKSVIDQLKADAEVQGIPSLYLDGGDFGEGSSFYFSNHGVDSLKALDKLGVDVTVLGNHDFILGGKELRNQIKKADLKAKMLSSNLKGKVWMGLKKILPDYVDYNFEGKKVRIFGLTTNEIHYMYPLRPLGYIANPHKAGIKQARKARKDGVDFTIALTHLGLSNDIKLVEKSRSIDMVVGGHSHTLLSKPQFTKNLSGKLVPIIQAGAHSGHVGVMKINLLGNGQAELLDYRMISISKDLIENHEMKQFVEEASKTREEYFGRNWNEVIGFSEIDLSGNLNGRDIEKNTCWSKHIARLTRQVAGAELGLQFDVFQGELIKPGHITFGDMIDNFPHFRKWGDNGWKITQSRVSGFLLKNILNLLANSELGLQVTVDGIKIKNKNGLGTKSFNPRTDQVSDALVNNQAIEPLRFYTIGLPSEVPYGMNKLFGLFGRLILRNQETIEDGDFWPHLENYLKQNSPLRCLED